MDGSLLWKLIACEPDIIYKILAYVSYQDISNLEESSKFFKWLLVETGVWRKKILHDFPNFEMPEKLQESLSEVYWQLRYLRHYCDSGCYNICNICYKVTHCFNITKCQNCDGSSYLLPY